MNRLTARQILILHGNLIDAFGGIGGTRDENLLESATDAPFQTFGGHDFYPTLTDKAARLGFGLIKNHPFLDGNKRTGTHAMLVFLELNGARVTFDADDLIALIFGAASGSVPYENFLNWLEAHTKNEN